MDRINLTLRRRPAVLPALFPRADHRARFTVALVAALLDCVAITLSAFCVGLGYYLLAQDMDGIIERAVAFGFPLALVFVILSLLRSEYAAANFTSSAGHMRRVSLLWNTTFLTALVLLYAVQESAAVSRLVAVLIYVIGYFAVLGARLALVRWVKRRAEIGRLCMRRIVLVGDETDVRLFGERYRPWTIGIEVVASAVLRGVDTMADDLSLAAAIARIKSPDDIFILLPWKRVDVIDAAIAAFMKVPAAVHLGPPGDFERFRTAKVATIGPISSLNVVRHPLTLVERFAKRAIDVVAAAGILIVLSPLLVAIAMLIKLDSPGSVLFVQRRGGFNRHSFRLYKFRSMSVAEDGPDIRQAARGDARVTRVGRVLRRSNLDELPQLWNVLRGEMSLIGPRPHAVAHDFRYARTIADYARRHNVKPGITGWAQIHGLRGATSDEAMEARVGHDLWYIDNWSLGLDIRILVSTLVMIKAYRNAY